MEFFKKYKSFVLGVIFITLGFIFFYSVLKTLNKQEEKSRQQKLIAAHKTAIEELKGGVENLNLLASGIRAYVKVYPKPEITDIDFFNFVASQIENSIYTDSIAVSLIDTNQFFKLSVSRSVINPVDLVGKSVYKIRNGKDFDRLTNISKNEEIVMVDPFNLVEGWAGIAINQGIHKNGIPIGYVAVVINVQHILNNIYKTVEYENFTHRFKTKEGFDFDRFAVYDGTEKTDSIDPENYKQYDIKESDFYTSEISLYGLPIWVSTAYKKQEPLPSRKYLYLAFILLSIAILYIIYQISLTEKLNVKLQFLGEKQKETHEETLSSINYAKRIQTSFIPKESDIKKRMQNLFVFFKPKDIVSGDFYWYAEIQNKKIIAAVDCTGHGVPGALMTSIGNGSLNNIVIGDKISNPGLILEELDQRIVSILNQDKNTSNDGMDAALCVIDEDNQTIEFAGAFRPLYLYRDGALIEYRGDRFPIGGLNLEANRVYTTHVINYLKGDTFYLFSDGYIDQFGGPKGKKFKTRQFKDLLKTISHKPMDEQKQLITSTFNNWKGATPQTDDVLVVGFRV